MKIFNNINLDDLTKEEMSELSTIMAEIRNILISKDDYKKFPERKLNEFIDDRFYLISIFPNDIKVKNYNISKDDKVKVLMLLNEITDKMSEVLEYID